MKALRIPASVIAILLCAAITTARAQTKEDIFTGTTEISWLGLDFSQAKFIGTATQFKDAGEITNSDMRDKYIPGWNQLFLDEMKKYNVAEAVHRAEVKYLVEITDKSNSSFKGDFFSSNSDDYKKLDEEKIKKIVKGYDFKGKTGIGLLFFIDGMSKGKEEANAWVTFVDMKSKTVLLTKNQSGKPKGFGFKNYWAGSFLDILKSAKANFNTWK